MTKPCEHCEWPIETTAHNRRYCNESCRQKAYRARRAVDRFSMEEITAVLSTFTMPTQVFDGIVDKLEALRS